MQPSSDYIPPGPGAPLVVRPVFRSAASVLYVLAAGAVGLGMIPGFLALHRGDLAGGIGRLLLALLAGSLLTALILYLLRQFTVTVDHEAVRWPGGRVKEAPRDRIAGVSRRLVGECLVDARGDVLMVLPNALNRAQVEQIADALGVPHLDKHGVEFRRR